MSGALADIHGVNAKLGTSSPAVAVPVVPTVGMMLAAADAMDVFVDGDRVGAWILPLMEAVERVPDFGGDLSERFGHQRAFELAVVADLFAGCISGLDEWTTKRGYEGSSNMVDGWFSPIVDRCPPGGWPTTQDGVNDDHWEFLKTQKGVPFAYDTHMVPWVNRDELRIAPKRCASIMALRAAQRDMAFDQIFSISDMIDFATAPFVPGRSMTHHYDDEERHHILAAAAWRGAVSWLMNDSREHPEPMPVSPEGAAVHLSRTVYRFADRASWDMSGFWAAGPYSKVSLICDEATLELEAVGSTIDARAFLPGGREMRLSGFDIRLPWANRELERMVRSISSSGVTRLAATPIPRVKDLALSGPS